MGGCAGLTMMTMALYGRLSETCGGGSRVGASRVDASVLVWNSGEAAMSCCATRTASSAPLACSARS